MNPPLSESSQTLTLNLPRGYSIGRRGRVLLVLWVLTLSGGFALASWLTPNERGFGTHRQLGLPPCTFQSQFQLPCPSCGMTTSFSCFVRGRIIQAAEANIAGLVLAAFCFLQIPWSLVSIWQGRLWRVNEPELTLMWLLITLCALAALQWGYRLLTG